MSTPTGIGRAAPVIAQHEHLSSRSMKSTSERHSRSSGGFTPT